MISTDMIMNISNRRGPYQPLLLFSPSSSVSLMPGPYDVICARGKQAYNHEGNKYFRGIVTSATEKYSNVKSKLQRSMIVTEIVDVIRAKGNGFIRQNEKGEWVECTDVMCREKVGQHFRNALGCQYKSSTKIKRRIKDVCIPRPIHSLSDIVFSNKVVKTVMERLSIDVIFIEESSDDAFYEKVFTANMKLMKVFKTEKTLVKQFQHQLCVGQQLQQAPSSSSSSSSSYRRGSSSRMKQKNWVEEIRECEM
jgi:hypothetical protein